MSEEVSDQFRTPECVLKIHIENQYYNISDILNAYLSWKNCSVKCSNCNNFLQEKEILDLSSNQYLVLSFYLFKYISKLHLSIKKKNFVIGNADKNVIIYDKYCFRIIGGIFHYGNTIASGHYSALISKNNKWIHANDEKIEKMSWNEMNDYDHGGNIYLLFLEKM